MFGFQEAAPLAPGDVNGDGNADLFANGFLQDGPTGSGEGRVWVFDGTTGDVLYPITDPTPAAGGQFAFAMDATDYNFDGTPDLYLGQSPHHISGTAQRGGTYVFDGRDGSLLKALELPESVDQVGAEGNLGPNLGWSVTAPGDLNGDGQPDFVAGAPFFDVGENQDEGRLFVFLSRGLLLQACPDVGASGFTDVSGNVHAGAIACIASLEIAQGGPLGLPEDQYGPTLAVRRDQMASFIARTIDVAEPGALAAHDGTNRFPCPSGETEALTPDNVHYDSIQRLAQAGVVLGGPGELPDDCYGPDLLVTRAQMASFINRAIEEVTGAALASDQDFFDDDDASVHEANINGVASEEIVLGKGARTYDPSSSVRRDQMASFIGRTAGFLVQSGGAAPPT